MRANFDQNKALELILYIAERVSDPGFHRVSKILYFADKEHLESFGRLITQDNYVAMKHGPVPSASYDILKFVRNVDGNHVDDRFRPLFDAFTVKGGYNIVPLRDADVDLLSDSEIQCLDSAIEQYGGMSFQNLTNASHDDAWDAADENETIRIEAIARTCPSARELLAHIADPYPDN